MGWVLLAVVAIVVMAGIWTAVDALRVRDRLVEAGQVVPLLEEQVLAGDDAAVALSVRTLRDAASEAERTTSRPHWTLTSWLPGVGPNVQAVRTLSRTVSELAEGPLPSLPAVVASASPASLAPREGRVDVASLAAAAPVVVAADEGVSAAVARLGGIDRRALLPQVREAVGALSDQLAHLQLSTATASRAVQLVPPMMGIDGPRDYLVLVQNNAEPRALGGIVGSVLVLRADGGSVELVEQVAGNSIDFDEPLGDLTESETALFGSQLGRYLVNVTSTPDFPRAAQIASAMWASERGEVIDGVVSIDPVALAALLEGTGPVSTDTGMTLDPGNAAQYLLNQIYLDEPEPAIQDRFFDAAAAAIFTALTTGAGDPAEIVRQLAAGADAGRVMLWSADPVEQGMISGTAMSGEVATDPAHPQVGVYLNDGTGSKAGFYLEMQSEMLVTECRPDGSQRLELSISLTSRLPDPALLPSYVSGGGQFVRLGLLRTNVAFYAPAGGEVLSVTSATGEQSVLAQRAGASPVALTSIDLEPGETAELVVDVLTAKQTSTPPRLRVTPGPTAGSSSIDLTCAASP